MKIHKPLNAALRLAVNSTQSHMRSTKTVLQSRLSGGSLELNLAGLPKALYMVEVQTSNGQALKRLVIE